MADKFIDVSGTKLFYTERNENKPYTIFFFHGNSSSHQTWNDQLNSAALSGFRLIAFDLPAHGLSDEASVITANYTLAALAKLMVKAVRQLSANKPFILAGVSLGTNIIAEMMAYEILPVALLLAGPCIVGEKFTPDKFVIPGTKIGVGFVDDPEDEDILDLGRLAINDHHPEKINLIVSDFKAVKGNFRSNTGQSFANGAFSDEIELVRKKGAPVLIVFGAADGAIYPDYLDGADLPFWKNKIVKLKEAGHWVHIDEPELFTGLLAEFSNEQFSKAGS